MSKVIMLGTAESVFQPDYKMKNAEFWAVGSAFGKHSCKDIKRIDKGFEFHVPEELERLHTQRNLDFNKFKNIPIYVHNKDHEFIRKHVKNAIDFPFKKVLEFVRDFYVYDKEKQKDQELGYFDSSFVWMTAFAVMEGYKDIEYFKILLSAGQEYFLERPGLSSMIIQLMNRDGLKVSFPEDCELFQADVFYAYKQDNRPKIYKMKSYQKHLYNQLLSEFHNIEAYTASINKNLGAIECYNLIKSGIPEDNLEKKLEASKEIIRNHMQNLTESKERYLQFFGAVQGLDYQDTKGI